MNCFEISDKNHKARSIRAVAFIVVLVILFAGLAFTQTSTSFAADLTQESADAAASEGVAGGAFEVTAFRMNAAVHKDHSYDVEETISVNIPDRLKSIEFAIPSGNFRIRNLTVEDTAYETRKASEASTVSIIDPEKLSEGSHSYTIKYRIQEYQDRDDSKDIFYFNVLLPEWKQPIGRVDIYVSFPEDFPWDDMQCYAGQFGVQDVENKISFGTKKSSKSVTVTGNMIPENFGITLKAQLPDGYWEGALNGSWAFVAAILSMTAAAAVLALLWLIGGRDPKTKKDFITKPVEGVDLIDLGYIYNSTVDIRDVILMIISFAEKGYLRISEYAHKKYRLYKVSDPADEEKLFRSAYNTLFEGVYTGRSIDMDDLGDRLERIRSEISDDVAAGFSSPESLAFTPISRTFRYAGAALLGIGLGAADAFSYFYEYLTPDYVESVAIALTAAVFSLIFCRRIDNRDSASVSEGRFAELSSGVLLLLPIIYTAYRLYKNTGTLLLPLVTVALSVVSVFFIVVMRARGSGNAELVAKIRQLRNFICHPEAHSLLENYLEDGDYYYDMLLYALAFGAEESWAISFLTLDVPGPEWYTDEIEGHAFSNLRGKKTTIDYARDIRSFIRTIENAYNGMQRRVIRK